MQRARPRGSKTLIFRRARAAPNGPPVVVLNDERWRPYDRVRLSALVARELDLSMLDEMPRLERCARLTVLSNRRVVRIDREPHAGSRSASSASASACA